MGIQQCGVVDHIRHRYVSMAFELQGVGSALLRISRVSCRSGYYILFYGLVRGGIKQDHHYLPHN